MPKVYEVLWKRKGWGMSLITADTLKQAREKARGESKKTKLFTVNSEWEIDKIARYKIKKNLKEV